MASDYQSVTLYRLDADPRTYVRLDYDMGDLYTYQGGGHGVRLGVRRHGRHGPPDRAEGRLGRDAVRWSGRA